MSDDNLPPHQTVVVHHSNNDYVNACDTYGGGIELLEAWKVLGDLLAHRSGWYFEIVNRGEALWSLGVFGESRLNIHVMEDGSYNCFDYEEDKSTNARTVGEIETWLTATGREEERSRPSKVMMNLAADNGWQNVKTLPIKIEVSWSDGWFLASIEKLPHEVVFERELKLAITNARRMFVDFFSAPSGIAEQLVNVTVEIDPKAVAQMLSTS